MELGKKVNSIIFDRDKKKFKILSGDIGEYDLLKVKKVRILYEDAKYYKKSPPFSHTLLLSSFEPLFVAMKNVYVGIEIVFDDNKKVYAYVSEEKQQQFSDEFHKTKREAEKIKEMFENLKE